MNSNSPMFSENGLGYLHNLNTNEHYHFITNGYSKGSYLTAAFLMVAFVSLCFTFWNTNFNRHLPSRCCFDFLITKYLYLLSRFCICLKQLNQSSSLRQLCLRLFWHLSVSLVGVVCAHSASPTHCHFQSISVILQAWKPLCLKFSQTRLRLFMWFLLVGFLLIIFEQTNFSLDSRSIWCHLLSVSHKSSILAAFLLSLSIFLLCISISFWRAIRRNCTAYVNCFCSC